MISFKISLRTHRPVAVLLGTMLTIAAMSANPTPSLAQTAPGTSGTSAGAGQTSQPFTTIAPAIGVTIAHEVPTGFTAKDLPLNAQRTQINVVNNSNTMLFNQPIVVKFAAKPDTIYYVRDPTGSVGIINGPTSVWFHTIDSIAPKEQLTFTVTWNKVCPGRWMLGARVGETITGPVLQWIGPSPANGACPADETASPTTVSELAQNLAWPASFPAPVEKPVIPFPTNPSTTTVPPIVGSTKAPTATVAPSTTTTTGAPATAPAAPSQTPTAKPTTTRPTPSTVLVCQTVNGVRVCSRKGARVIPVPPSLPGVTSTGRTTQKKLSTKSAS